LGGIPLVIIEPQEAVVAYVNVSILIGCLITLPVFTYNMWAFIAPALMKREKTLILCLVAPSVLMFLLGVAFGYVILLPAALRFMIDEAAPLATPMISLGSAISLITSMLLALGIVFQWPLITAALGRLGIVKAGSLSAYRRHAIVLIVLLAGIITPDPSIVPQLILSVPMVMLYELGILTSKIAGGA
jgi:sec-independent protein translocase protein TatC